VFFSSQNIDFPFYLKRLLELSFFHAPSLEDLGVLMIFEEKNHFFKNFFSNGFNILAVDAYSGMELCTPTWLNHDYGDGRVVDILMVDAYSGVEVCTPIFLGEASSYCGWQITLKKIKTQMYTSRNKAQRKQELLCG
jgi:hypothetical protein